MNNFDAIKTSLNEALRDGDITQEQYDEKMQKLLDKENASASVAKKPKKQNQYKSSQKDSADCDDIAKENESLKKQITFIKKGQQGESATKRTKAKKRSTSKKKPASESAIYYAEDLDKLIKKTYKKKTSTSKPATQEGSKPKKISASKKKTSTSKPATQEGSKPKKISASKKKTSTSKPATTATNQEGSKPKKISASKKKTPTSKPATTATNQEGSKPKKISASKKKTPTSKPATQEGSKIKKELSKNKNITAKQGKAVLEYTEINRIASRFLSKKTNGMTYSEALNLAKFINIKNELGKFNSKSEGFGVVSKIYNSLKSMSFKNGKDKKNPIGTKLTEDDWKAIESIAKSQYVPLSVQHIKRYINLVKTQDSAKAKKLLEEMNLAKQKNLINANNLRYKEWSEIYKKLEKKDFSFSESLKGLQGVLAGLDGVNRAMRTNKNNAHQKSKKKAKISRRMGEIDEVIPEEMTTSEMAKQKFNLYEFDGKFKTLFKYPNRGFSAMVYGEPSSGKTAFCMQFAQYLGKYFGKVLYISFEEHASYTQRISMELNGVDSENITWRKDIPYNELSDYDFVFIDSVTALDLDFESFVKMKDENPQTAFILIFQVVKNGNFAGRKAWEHEVDIVISIRDFEATSRKRLGTGETIEIKD